MTHQLVVWQWLGTLRQQLHGSGDAGLMTEASRQKCVVGRRECQAQSRLRAPLPCEQFKKYILRIIQFGLEITNVKMLTKLPVPVRRLSRL